MACVKVLQMSVDEQRGNKISALSWLKPAHKLDNIVHLIYSHRMKVL